MDAAATHRLSGGGEARGSRRASELRKNQRNHTSKIQKVWRNLLTLCWRSGQKWVETAATAQNALPPPEPKPEKTVQSAGAHTHRHTHNLSLCLSLLNLSSSQVQDFFALYCRPLVLSRNLCRFSVELVGLVVLVAVMCMVRLHTHQLPDWTHWSRDCASWWSSGTCPGSRASSVSSPVEHGPMLQTAITTALNDVTKV